MVQVPDSVSDEDYKTPEERAKITRWFLEKYDDDQRKLVNAVTHAGVTPLMLAVKTNYEY